MKSNKDDVVVGCITGYNFAQIAPWVNSLDQCGFKGKKVVLCYNVAKNVLDELTSRGYSVLAFSLDESGNAVYNEGKPFSIVVERFFHLWAMLKSLKGQHRYLIHTDVKDVIFQRNPSEFLESIIDQEIKLVAASESIRYEYENWGRENMIDSYGNVIYEHVKNNVIVNAGTLSGDFDTLIDFFLQVYMVSVGGKTHNPDQAAVNILLYQKPYVDILAIMNPDSAWACQAGTTHDPNKISQYGPLLRNSDDARSYLDSVSGVINNRLDEPFYMVHQYDRVPTWKAALEKKYGI